MTKILIDNSRLPSEMADRKRVLQEYFAGRTIHLSQGPDTNTLVEIGWPKDAEYYVDPYILDGIDAFKPGLEISQLYCEFEVKEGYQISLFDSWSLLAWSRYLNDHPDTKEILLLHIDDHDDLMTPKISKRNDQFWNMLTNEPFDLYDPISVENAVLSCAIGIGSFISPLVHTIPEIEIRHLCATEYNITRKQVQYLSKTWDPDHLLESEAQKPSVTVNNSGEIAKDSFNHVKYRVFDNLQEFVKDCPSAPIFLHIDMDYFNNRYNCDSDWGIYSDRHDPPLPAILTAIDDLFDAIDILKESIVDITIALSPGFFPSEFWVPAMERVDNRIRRKYTPNF